jgi:hypothetical protein
MASAASNPAMATEVLAVQGLMYKIVPNKIATMFIVSGSQFLGYCIAGLMKRELLNTFMTTPHLTLFLASYPLVSFHDAISYRFSRNCSPWYPPRRTIREQHEEMGLIPHSVLFVCVAQC